MEALQEVFSEMRFESTAYELEGKGIGKLQTLRFAGGPALGEQRARKFLQLQRVNNAWRRV